MPPRFPSNLLKTFVPFQTFYVEIHFWGWDCFMSSAFRPTTTGFGHVSPCDLLHWFALFFHRNCYLTQTTNSMEGDDITDKSTRKKIEAFSEAFCFDAIYEMLDSAKESISPSRVYLPKIWTQQTNWLSKAMDDLMLMANQAGCRL